MVMHMLVQKHSVKNENKLVNCFLFEEIWKNGEIQEYVFLQTRDSQTLYITRLGGDCFCYIPFSLLRRPHQQNVTLDLVTLVLGYFRRKHCESPVKKLFLEVLGNNNINNSNNNNNINNNNNEK